MTTIVGFLLIVGSGMIIYCRKSDKKFQKRDNKYDININSQYLIKQRHN